MRTFPTALFAPGSLTKRLVGASTSGGQSLSGQTQTSMTSGGGLWVFEFGESILFDRAKFKTWEAIARFSDSGATRFVVPLCDRRSGPFVDPKRLPGVSFGDDSVFSDGALWNGELVTATITGSAALRATRITLAIDHTLDGGEPFTIWHGTMGQRMYQVVEVISQGGGAADVTIRPPLRQATPDGITCDFDNPRSTMTVSGDMDAALENLKFGKSPGVKFIESLAPVGADD